MARFWELKSSRIMRALVIFLIAFWVPSAAACGAPFYEGKASYYGWSHEGRKMANGKPFHALRLTAASKTLPLGTRVRVTHLENGRSIDLVITDRGPYIRGRILDISLG